MRTKFWTTIGLRKEPFYVSKEQKDIALRIYHQTESVTETIRILGYYQHVRNLYTWIAEENTPPKTRKEYPVINNPPDHPRNLH